MSAIPLIACGKHIEIARSAAKTVQPEYECTPHSPFPIPF
jgi:hypothetical protein